MGGDASTRDDQSDSAWELQRRAKTSRKRACAQVQHAARREKQREAASFFFFFFQGAAAALLCAALALLALGGVGSGPLGLAALAVSPGARAAIAAPGGVRRTVLSAPAVLPAAAPTAAVAAAARLERVHADLFAIGASARNDMGHTGQFADHVSANFALVAREMAAAAHAATAAGVGLTVCEVGFNLGHSAAVFVAASGAEAVSRYVAFDKVEAPGVELSMRLLRSEFAATEWELVAGDSRDTVSAYHRRRPDVRCDLLHVDGDHGLVMPSVDLDSLRAMSSERALVVFDDCGCAETEASWWCIGPTRAFKKAVAEGVLEQLSFKEILVNGGVRGTCAGRLRKVKAAQQAA